MPVDIEAFLTVISPLSVALSLLVGFLLGHLYMFEVHRTTSARAMAMHVFIAGETFVMAMAVMWAATDTRWEVWLGAGLLWVIYSMGAGVGLRVRQARYLSKWRRRRRCEEEN